ncbi:MAG: hypothetical protein E6G32_00535 [Actinobacteria bacterium]|nr:MAG: hypothetical protein E6G32_00535 [Actinomycetota bacterium]
MIATAACALIGAAEGAGAVSTNELAGRLDAKALVLQPADVRGLLGGRFVYSGQILYGMTTGYERNFVFRGGKDELSIADGAWLFDSAGGAVNGFTTQKSVLLDLGLHRLRLTTRVGQQTCLYGKVRKGPNFHDATYVMLWRHGRVVAQLSVLGTGSAGGPSVALALAQKQEARIAHALAG